MLRNNLIIIATALAVGTTTLRAQGHLSFENTPITGDIYTFCTRLAMQGYRLQTTHHTDNETTAVLTARRGNDTVEVTVSDEGTTNVRHVTLCYKPTRKWGDLAESYAHIRTRLTTTYGTPREDITPDDVPDNPFQALADGDIHYKAVYVTPQGTVTVMLTPHGKQARVVVNYRDGLETKH